MPDTLRERIAQALVDKYEQADDAMYNDDGELMVAADFARYILSAVWPIVEQAIQQREREYAEDYEQAINEKAARLADKDAQIASLKVQLGQAMRARHEAEREKAQAQPDLTHDVSMELAAKDWARDDNLWTTQDTAQASLICFGRYLLAKQSAALAEKDAQISALQEEKRRICLIGSDDRERADRAEAQVADRDAQIAALQAKLASREDDWRKGQAIWMPSERP